MVEVVGGGGGGRQRVGSEKKAVAGMGNQAAPQWRRVREAGSAVPHGVYRT